MRARFGLIARNIRKIVPEVVKGDEQKRILERTTQN